MTINIKITSNETIEYKGKQYRPVAIRLPKEGEVLMELTGYVNIAHKDFNYLNCIILEEVIPPYRTPTDEDALRRPVAEFWDVSKQSPYTGTLLAVIDRSSHMFVGHVNGGVSVWEHCRIPNEKATNDNL